MNDEEIINEINEILVYLEDEGEYHLDKDCDTEWLLAVKEVLNLFNRQQAEIERLKNEIKGFDNFLKETDCSLKEIRDNAIKDCVNKYTEMLIDEYHLRTDLQIANIKRLEQKILTEMVGEQNEKSN